MTTESDAVLATIVDNWGNGGYGGATPTIQSTSDISVDRWAALDAVIVLHDTLDELHPPVNDKFVDKQYIMDIRVTSITSEDQLKLLVEEVEYLLNNTAITGFTSVRVTRKWRGSSDRKRKVYRNDITIEFWARVSSSAIAPDGGTFAGPTTLASLLFSDGGSTVDIIRDEDNMATDDAAALATQQSIKAYVDAVVLSDLDVTITGAYLEDLLMFGSGNKAFVPATLHGMVPPNALTGHVTGLLYNTAGAGADLYATFVLPVPCVKGGLKLYIDDIRIGLSDADANNYLTHIYLYGIGTTTSTAVYNDGTNRTSSGEWTYDTSDADMSSYSAAQIAIRITTDDSGSDFDMVKIGATCYYAT